MPARLLKRSVMADEASDGNKLGLIKIPVVFNAQTQTSKNNQYRFKDPNLFDIVPAASSSHLPANATETTEVQRELNSSRA